MTGHAIASIKKDGRVIIITCECHVSFDSIESEALARSYHAGHLRHLREQAAK